MLVIPSTLLPGCGSDCSELARRICKCEENDRRRERCHRTIDYMEATNGPSDAEEEACARLLGSCTCEKLREGGQTAYEACGVHR